MKKFLLLSTLFLSFSTLLNAQDATYKIEFISNWSSTTHPMDYPSSSAHWSPLVGTTHKDAASLFALGVTASDGVEQVAETGATTIIKQEINVLITAGLAYEIIQGSGLSTGPGTITIDDVNVDGDFPFISLTTMIAPSPDWIAMIANFKLTDGSNNWLPSISVNVYTTDAGTDSGTTYNSGNVDTNPRQNISSLENTTPFSDQIIGTFVFTLSQVLAVDDITLQNDISIYPNPNQGKIFIANGGSTLLQKAELYAINGKKIKTFTNISTQKSLEFNSLNSGLYFLRINSDKGSITKKLIIQ